MPRIARLVHLSVALLSTLSLSACGAPVETGESVESEAEAITGGSLISGEPFAVKWFPAASQDFCSGTKIGEKRFLTAKHCVTGIPVGRKLTITNADDGSGGDTFTVAGIHRYPTNPSFLATGVDTDVAMIDVLEPSPNIPIFDAFRASHVGEGLTGGWLNAFGCDTTNPDRYGKKQFFRFFGTEFLDEPAMSAGYIRAAATQGFAQVCSGDSGGALFFLRSDGVWEIAGVVRGQLLPTQSSMFARVGRIRRWLANPTFNSFVNGSQGSFVNQKGNNCIRGNVAPAATLNFCELKTIPSDRQYWTLVKISTDVFKIKNNVTGTCLASANAVIQLEPCGENVARLKWRFVSPVTANGFKSFHIRNEADINGCIGTSGGVISNNVQLSSVSCSSGVIDSQTFVFVP